MKSIKNHLRLFDKDFQKELNTKFLRLEGKLNEISNGKEDFYKDIQKTKLDDLYKYIDSAKQTEDLIFKTLTRIESLKFTHEESASIFVKLNELNESNQKMNNTIENDTEILIKMKNSIDTNNSIIKSNLNLMKERLNKLKNKK